MKEKTADSLRATIDDERNGKAIYMSQRDRLARHLVAIAKRLAEGKAPADIELVRLYNHKTVQEALETVEIIYGPNGPPQARKPLQAAPASAFQPDQEEETA